MNIVFNGEDLTTRGQTLVEFFRENNVDISHCAVALNGNFIVRNSYAQTILHDGDQLELLVPMQGG